MICADREVHEENRKKEMEELFIQNQAKMKEEERIIEENRKDEYHHLSLFYREKNLEKKIKKQQIHKEICNDIMKFILDLSDVKNFIYFYLF